MTDYAIDDYQDRKTVPESIDDCDFTVRTYNCLKRVGIHTLGALTAMTEDRGPRGERLLGHPIIDGLLIGAAAGVGATLIVGPLLGAGSAQAKTILAIKHLPPLYSTPTIGPERGEKT